MVSWGGGADGPVTYEREHISTLQPGYQNRLFGGLHAPDTNGLSWPITLLFCQPPSSWSSVDRRVPPHHLHRQPPSDPSLLLSFAVENYYLHWRFFCQFRSAAGGEVITKIGEPYKIRFLSIMCVLSGSRD